MLEASLLESMVAYLRGHAATFRLSSRPSPEARPALAEPIGEGSVALVTHVLVVGRKPALVCVPRGAHLSLRRLEHELGTKVVEGSAKDLAAPYSVAEGPIPPLGGAIGALVIVDEAVTAAASVLFEAFAPTEYFEMPYAELARLEQPRVIACTVQGELPEAEAAE